MCYGQNSKEQNGENNLKIWNITHQKTTITRTFYISDPIKVSILGKRPIFSSYFFEPTRYERNELFDQVIMALKKHYHLQNEMICEKTWNKLLALHSPTWFKLKVSTSWITSSMDHFLLIYNLIIFLNDFHFLPLREKRLCMKEIKCQKAYFRNQKWADIAKCNIMYT